MAVVARYGGRCSACGQAIVPGHRIEWKRGAPVRHLRCDAPWAGALDGDSATAASTRRVDSGTIVLDEREGVAWRTCPCCKRELRLEYEPWDRGGRIYLREAQRCDCPGGPELHEIERSIASARISRALKAGGA